SIVRSKRGRRIGNLSGAAPAARAAPGLAASRRVSPLRPGASRGGGPPASAHWPPDAQPFREPECVEGRVAVGVVVAVHVDIASPARGGRRAGNAPRIARLTARPPGPDAVGPPVELRVRVAARVNRLGAV